MPGHYDCSVSRLAYTPAWVECRYPVRCDTAPTILARASVTDIASGQPVHTEIEPPIDTVEVTGCPDHASSTAAPSLYTWPPPMPLSKGVPMPARVIVKQPVIRVDSYGKGQMFDLFC